jgi:hypothetical protein
MGFFDFNKSRPYHGTDKNIPRKKGIARFFEIISIYGWDLIKLNLLFIGFLLPSAVAFSFIYFGINAVIIYIITPIAAIPVGGALAAYFFCISSILRYEPIIIWSDFKRKFIENFKKAVLPGIFYAFFLFLQIYQMSLINAQFINFNFVRILIVVIAPLFLGMFLPYIFLQISYINLDFISILQNSITLVFSNFGRAFMGSLFGSLIYFMFVLNFPSSIFYLPFIIIFGFSLSWLLCVMWVWPVIDKHFSIEETLQNSDETEL